MDADITNHHQRIQQRVMVEDPQLSQLGLPLQKINKHVGDFVRRQEALTSVASTKQMTNIVCKRNVSDATIPDEVLPTRMPETDRPQLAVFQSQHLAGKSQSSYSSILKTHRRFPSEFTQPDTQDITTDLNGKENRRVHLEQNSHV